MRDVVVLQRLREKGVSFNDMDKILAYESVEHKPRVLDKAPTRLSLARAEDGCPVYSIYMDYISSYNKIKEEFPLEFGTFDIRGNKRQCDIEVFWTAQTLLHEGITAVPGKLRACAELFKLVFTTPGDGVLTKAVLLKRIEQFIATDYYMQQLVKAIYRTAYEYSDFSCEWLEMTEFDHTFTNAVHKGVEFLNQAQSTFELQKFVKENAANAKADETFMESVGKAFSSNKTKPAMIAMIYFFRDTPGILDYGYIVSGK